MTAKTMTNGLRRRAILATALAAIGFAATDAGVAHARVAEAGIGRDLVDIAVVDHNTGQPLRVWRHRGRAYVAGQPGDRYSLRVTNNTGERLLVVMSVDGVNVLTGQTAGYGQRGYVFRPYESYDVSGWRKSDTEVAAFTFAPLSGSYAARTGRPGDVGVIGVAAFRERLVAPAPVEPTMESRSSARDDLDEVVVGGSRLARSAPAQAPLTQASRARLEEKLGTGHGARERSVVMSVSFERASAQPQQVRQIAYDTYDNLAALGIIRRPPDIERRPRPFPASGYVPDPPGAP